MVARPLIRRLCRASRVLRRPALVLFLLGLGVVGGSWTPSQTGSFLRGAPPSTKLAAPELEGGVAWLNTDRPIKLAELRGRIVLLDFWTLCCINCLHTSPDLARLEAKYPGVLVVIGVHTPKFPHEKETESVRKAILRYEIKHPVVNDAQGIIWRRYGVDAWPTLFLIDPEGNIDRYGSGEGLYEALDRRISELIRIYQGKKLLKTTPLSLTLVQRQESPARPLYFPGKVLADAAGNRLFIADSTHHRIVITDLAGKKIAIAGSGQEGLQDGPFAQARFSDPQGMALVGQKLYVADRKNHCVRALDLETQQVRTVAGTGRQAQDWRYRLRGGPASQIPLNSPWDLLAWNDKLFIAMAGHHQIWTLDLKRDRVDPYAGTGREDLVDGPLDRACFAQPSGLATDGRYLYVADSEISALRAVPLDPSDGEVRTLVGKGLFQFGDVDGIGDQVRLQHVLGVAWRAGKLYVADTYNNKIKVVDPAQARCQTLRLMAAEPEKGPLLSEPGGLSFAGDKLYVADTNNHRIRVVDLATGRIATLPLNGVPPPAVSPPPASSPPGGTSP
jgi:sugar lactone lactonase YvrE